MSDRTVVRAGSRTGRGMLLAAVALTACGSRPEAAAAPALPAGMVRLSEGELRTSKVVVDTARLDTVAATLTVPGTLGTPEQLTAHVGSIVEGRVEEVFVLPGDRVRAGQALVAIHTHEVAVAERDLAAANAALTYAQAALARSRRLLEAEAVSREEVERRQMQFEEASAEQHRAEEVVSHLAPNEHHDAVMKAPRGGVVFSVPVRSGQAVKVGDPLVDLGDDTRLWLTGYVPENAAIHLRPGARLEVRVEALPGMVLPARVIRVGGVVDSLRRAVEVRVALDAHPEGIRPGMFGSLALPGAGREARVVLPADAVQRTAEGEAVYVVEGPGLFRQRPVTGTLLGDGRVAVSGLAAGTPVVTAGAYFVRAKLEGVPAE